MDQLLHSDKAARVPIVPFARFCEQLEGEPFTILQALIQAIGQVIGFSLFGLAHEKIGWLQE
ncbi:hypothetical protein DFQ28_003387 [Apophysomyces sp. BC1034]|nr:hypothetical protein DFQ28_003387 [Apophysomyces sp. BC1034]